MVLKSILFENMLLLFQHNDLLKLMYMMYFLFHLHMSPFPQLWQYAIPVV